MGVVRGVFRIKPIKFTSYLGLFVGHATISSMKFLKLLASIVTVTASASFINLGGMDVDHDPRYKPRHEPDSKEVSKCQINREGQTFLLNQKNNSLKNIYAFLNTTHKGSEIVQLVQEQISLGALVIRNLSESERTRRGLSKKTVALFDITENPSAIYVNFNDELGLLVNFFAHEAAHAIDPLIFKFHEEDMIAYNEYKRIYNSLGLDADPGKYLTDEQTDIMNEAWEIKEKKLQRNSYRAERHAFDEQSLVTKELASRNDCFKNYIQEHRNLNGLKLYENTPDEHIFNSYNIDPSYITK